MPSLKDLRNRISSVKSTKKLLDYENGHLTEKLKRAQDNV